jgi:staphylococcal nuclease domain-containing protein 1
VSIIGKHAPENYAYLEDAQAKAQEEAIGIWQKGLRVGAVDAKEVKTNERIQVMMTDIAEANRFYIRIQGGSEYAKIEAEMNRFNPAIVEDLEKPIKKGTICAARFSVDKKWYRAKVLGTLGKGEMEV